MRKLLLILALLPLLISCSKSQGDEFVVKGTTTQDRLNGVQVFLVPCDPMSPLFTSKAFEDSIGVDSVYIQNNSFEFRGRGEYLARITIDKHKRMGTQDLLIITEPGQTVNVVIDSISSGGGTRQNEALQQWKERLEAHSRIAGPVAQEIFRLRQQGDTVGARALSDSLSMFNKQFNNEIMDIARLLGEGTAYDLLKNRYSN